MRLPTQPSSSWRLLADDYTVLTYDPRGLSRSATTGGDQITVAGQAADALAVLDAVSPEPAYVFGHSGGALTTLALIERHPDRLRTAVLLEPPLVDLLPDAAHIRAEDRLVTEAYERDGVWAALDVFMAQTGLAEGGEQEAPPREMLAAMAANFDVFFGRMYASIGEYAPDFAALRAASTRIEVGVGTTTGGELANRAAVAFAARLGQPTVELPGDHNGFAADPEANAVVLRKLFS
ncbi:MAG: alpha/beta hydrolase [Pseudonocardiaceae bacterium]|nr:alpha/beta hydrolase [Pseudonocardiaceae bacterium]